MSDKKDRVRDKKRKWDVPSDQFQGNPTATMHGVPPGVNMAPTDFNASAPFVNPALQSFQNPMQTSTNQIPVANMMLPQQNKTAQFVKEVEINNSSNRYYLTKSQTHVQIYNKTGATVVVRGVYVRPGETPTHERPLFLHISANTQESVDDAERMIQDMTTQHQIFRDNNMLSEKVFVGIENLDPAFVIAPKIIGPKGAYVKHVTKETGARLQLKGKGSGYKEGPMNQESSEPMHLHITCFNERGLKQAKELTEDLIETVRKDYKKWQENRNRPAQHNMGYYNYNNMGGGYPPQGMYQPPYQGYGMQQQGYYPGYYYPMPGYEQGFDPNTAQQGTPGYYDYNAMNANPNPAPPGTGGGSSVLQPPPGDNQANQNQNSYGPQMVSAEEREKYASHLPELSDPYANTRNMTQASPTAPGTANAVPFTYKNDDLDEGDDNIIGRGGSSTHQANIAENKQTQENKRKRKFTEENNEKPHQSFDHFVPPQPILKKSKISDSPPSNQANSSAKLVAYDNDDVNSKNSALDNKPKTQGVPFWAIPPKSTTTATGFYI